VRVLGLGRGTAEVAAVGRLRYSDPLLPAIDGVVPADRQGHLKNLQVGVELAAAVDVGIAQAMGLEGQPAGESKRRPLVLGEVFPVGVEGTEVVVGQADGEQLRFLMAQAVLAVVGPGGDPEEFRLEAVVEGDGGIGL
ncbi:MAG: hypothetical protein ACK55I_38145, partial [bacterium]